MAVVQKRPDDLPELIIDLPEPTKKKSTDSEYGRSESASSQDSTPKSVMLNRKRAQVDELLRQDFIVGTKSDPQASPKLNGMAKDKERRSSLNISELSLRNRSLSREPSLGGCQHSSRSKSVNGHPSSSKEQKLRELYRHYNAISSSVYPSEECSLMVDIRLLHHALKALEGFRGFPMTKKQTQTWVKTVDDSEHHHPGYVSETNFIKAALQQFPRDEHAFDTVVENLKSALQWTLWPTSAEVVLGVHADTCGTNCEHLPEDLRLMLGSSIKKSPKLSPTSASEEKSPKGDSTLKHRTRELRHLFRRLDEVERQGVLPVARLRSLGRFCETLGHRTAHRSSHPNLTDLQKGCCHKHGEQVVWCENDYMAAVQELDLDCGEDGVTESKFVQVFEKRLPIDVETFDAILKQLEAAAKHLRNVDYASLLNERTRSHNSFNTYDPSGEREIESEKGPRAQGCVQRGCASACSVM